MKRSAAIKVISVLTFSTLMMANTKCEKQQVETRELKKNIRLADLSATTYLDNSGFSFSEVARSHFSGVLFERNDFFERNIYPSTEAVSGFQDQRYFQNSKLVSTMSSKTVSQLKTWFPNEKSQNIILNRESSCFITRPQHILMGRINSLEAYSGASLQLGLAINNPVIPTADFKMDKMRLSVSFDAIDPWTLQKVSSVNDEAFKNDYKVGFGINLGILHIGPEFYRTTGLAEVIQDGLRKVTKKLAGAILQEPRQEWQTRIIYSGDTYVAILGGSELGLKKGDKLKVFNETHTWNGQACGDSSVVTGSIIVSDVNDPWIIEIEDAGDLMSKAKVLNPKENESIEVGGLVRLDSFVKPVVPPPAAK